MFTFFVFILTFSSIFQSFKCQNTRYQNGYMPQNVARQVNPNTGQQVDANGNPITPGSMQGQPISGQQQPMMPTNSNMPGMGNQMPGQNPMPNQGFPQQNPALGGQNQQPQFPQNPQMPGTNQQFPPNQQFPSPNQQYPPYQGGGGYPINQYPNQYGPGGRGNHYPEAPHDLHLFPEGEFAYGYIMHTIASMLNNPTARNNLFALFNNLQMVMSNPKSGPIIQEFFNRWAHAIDGTTGTYPTNVVVQNVPTSASFLDTLKKKGNVLLNLAKDVTMAKTKALNSLFDNSIFSSAAQIGSNWANTGMQAVQGTVTPLLGGTPNTNGQTMTLTSPMTVGTTPITVTTPGITVQ